MIKQIIGRLYVYCLKKRFSLNNSNAWLVSGQFISDYKSRRVPWLKTFAIHCKGFDVMAWLVLGLTKANCSRYLSTVDYCRRHPLNGAYSKWIDDKLTLKYILDGTCLGFNMPKYYAQVDEQGRILPLMDFPEDLKKKGGGGGITALLQKKGELAVKRIAGSLGEGFYKVSYANGAFHIGSTEVTEDELQSQLHKLNNYLICEYLHPHPEIAKFCATVTNTIRVLVGKRADNSICLIKSFVRFGTKASGSIDNFNSGGVLSYINENGIFKGGYIFDFTLGETVSLICHPDSNLPLEGKVPLWDDIMKISNALFEILPQMKYLGIDFVATEKNEVKILEINSLTSLDTLQLDIPICESSGAPFFKEIISRFHA